MGVLTKSQWQSQEADVWVTVERPASEASFATGQSSLLESKVGLAAPAWLSSWMLGALMLVAASAAGGFWWRRRARSMKSRGMETEITASSSMVWTEEPNFAVAAFASEAVEAAAVLVDGDDDSHSCKSGQDAGRWFRSEPKVAVAGFSSAVSASSSAFVEALSASSALTASREKSVLALHRRIMLEAYASEARQTYEGAPIGPPPDLPSLLLKNRIVYLGSPITNEVTELIIAQLLYLNYESADKPVTMYINSTGSTLKNNTRYIGEQKVGMETDAFAIADCMAYIKPKVSTIAIGQAYGTAAMLLGLGAKGKRFALPNATIMLSEPREPPARGARQASDLKILAKEVLQNRKTMAELLAKATDREADKIVEDTQRCYYMSPDDAVTYNLIDKVLTPDKIKEQEKEAGNIQPSFMSAL